MAANPPSSADNAAVNPKKDATKVQKITTKDCITNIFLANLIPGVANLDGTYFLTLIQTVLKARKVYCFTGAFQPKTVFTISIINIQFLVNRKECKY